MGNVNNLYREWLEQGDDFDPEPPKERPKKVKIWKSNTKKLKRAKNRRVEL